MQTPSGDYSQTVTDRMFEAAWLYTLRTTSQERTDHDDSNAICPSSGGYQGSPQTNPNGFTSQETPLWLRG
jgi:hypothetical protein